MPKRRIFAERDGFVKGVCIALAMAAVGVWGGARSAAAGENAFNYTERSPLLLQYYYNPNCRMCDAATALVKTKEKEYGKRVRVFYKHLDGRQGRANTAEMFRVMQSMKVPKDVVPNLAVVVGRNEEFLGGSDIVIEHLPRILGERLDGLVAARPAEPVTEPLPAPSGPDHPEPAVKTEDTPKNTETTDELPTPTPGAAGDQPDPAPSTEAPEPGPDDFVEDPEATRPAPDAESETEPRADDDHAPAKAEKEEKTAETPASAPAPADAAADEAEQAE